MATGISAPVVTGHQRLGVRQLRMAENWLARQRNLWERRLDQLDSYLMKMKQERNK
jgi:hypothetical protein